VNEPESWLKRNGFLVAGVLLPLLVVLLFVLARTLPRVWVEDPRYDVVYGSRSNYDSTPRTIDGVVTAVDGRLRVRWTKPEQPTYSGRPLVYRWHAATGQVEVIPVPEPENIATFEATTDLFFPGFEGWRVDPSLRAPDGYEFNSSSRGSSGILTEILVSPSYREDQVIRKGGRVIPLPRTDDQSYGYSVEFFGWLVPAEEGR
jgi:hypothetical protein